MVRYVYDLICITMDINDNIWNERKNAEKLGVYWTIKGVVLQNFLYVVVNYTRVPYLVPKVTRYNPFI